MIESLPDVLPDAKTTWASDELHPRPMLTRPWRSLDGVWAFSTSKQEHPEDVAFDRTIRVPFAPETPASGVHATDHGGSLWYHTRVELAPHEVPGPDERLLVHFGGVDWKARVFVDGAFAREHEGGYTSFFVDVTRAARKGSFEIAVHATDEPGDLDVPRGKQTWKDEPHAIWYPRTSGLWRTVWLEKVPRQHVAHVAWTPNIDRFELLLRTELAELPAPGTRLRVQVSLHGEVLIDEDALVRTRRFEKVLRFPDPGIDAAREDLLWTPDHPRLLDVTFTLTVAGSEIDHAEGYTAMRSVSTGGRRFLLNGRPYPLRLVLHQGYWADTGLTGDDDRFRFDAEMIRRLGFNGVRLHQKVEDPRFYAWCDRVGLAVWAELPSAYAFNPESLSTLTRTWLDCLRDLASHPCIVAWVPFNESWGLPDLATRTDQREAQRAFYALTKAFDTTRLVSGNDGWEQLVTDMYTVHDYDEDPEKLLARYGSPDAIRETMWKLWPGGHRSTLEGLMPDERPVILSEFGGISCIPEGERGWGYVVVRTSDVLTSAYEAQLGAVNRALDLKGLHGFCYTQFADTYQEKNGLLDMARLPKADVERIARATRGQAPHPANPLWYSPRWRQGVKP
ncbi:glycoside hydrolase family 2 protein [Deinococcus yavapaiensis]|uniref:Glycosyl hydrolase family 2 n=1 Tax=Deinococcus yavapaiensis KR-236 TaxID=694435 RepID=A0A318SJZ6_9DEIO|nr:glycoside hydrolase family 2 TIM barrel-domain containing protein [Deinococcus yavapaiensis]PYE54606.1 glycosyl hydrolase family 2 [Deinococcus yavapaiensis KR-236]